MKDRPLLSYFKHGGKEHISIGGRAGNFMLLTLVMNFAVNSTSQVTGNLLRFSDDILADQIMGVTSTVRIFSLKLDIDQFFTCIEHSLIWRAWAWLQNLWENSKFSRRKYIVIPKKSTQRTALNHFFMKFGEFEQLKSYTAGLRRSYKETPQARFATSKHTCKGFVSILVQDIGKLLRIDTQSAVGFFGGTPILQKQGSPMGSPMSVFTANLVAIYMETSSMQKVTSRIQKMLNERYFKINIQRWVDDIYIDIATEREIEEPHREIIKTEIETVYDPFKLKSENSEIFVGIKKGIKTTNEGHTILDFHMATRDFKEQRLSKKPRFIHSSSNISKAQISGLMKGAVMRCVDTACDVEALYTTIVHTYGEFMMLGYQKRNFLQAVRSLSQRYHILREIYLKLMRT